MFVLQNNMKILVFGDNHGDLFSFLRVHEKSKEVEIAICLGDFTYFSEDLEPILEIINAMPKKILLTHGNHESEQEVREISKKHKNIEFLHKEIVKVGDYKIIFYGGGGFSHIDEEFEQFIKDIQQEIEDPAKTILVLHAPPANTKLDIPFSDYHSGTLSFREFIEEKQPLAVFAGHIHETFGKKDIIKDTKLFNPGPEGMIIDLKDLEKKRKKKKTK